MSQQLMGSGAEGAVLGVEPRAGPEAGPQSDIKDSRSRICDLITLHYLLIHW